MVVLIKLYSLNSYFISNCHLQNNYTLQLNSRAMSSENGVNNLQNLISRFLAAVDKNADVESWWKERECEVKFGNRWKKKFSEYLELLGRHHFIVRERHYLAHLQLLLRLMHRSSRSKPITPVSESKKSATKKVKVKLEKSSLKYSGKYKLIPFTVCVQKPSVPKHLTKYLLEITAAIYDGNCVSTSFLSTLTPKLRVCDYSMMMQWEKNNLGHLKFWFFQTFHQDNIPLYDCIRLYQTIAEKRKLCGLLSDRWVMSSCNEHLKETTWFVPCMSSEDDASCFLLRNRLSLEKCLFAAEQSILISNKGIQCVGKQTVEVIVRKVEQSQMCRFDDQRAVSPVDLWLADLDWSADSYLFNVIRKTYYKNGFIWATNEMLVQQYFNNIFNTTSIITQLVSIITNYILLDVSKIPALSQWLIKNLKKNLQLFY